ncbi:MAG TPA: hypothetical protein VGO70_01720, partial [Arsenicitalea sp.]|nr:hypothetical protein [Arsenicitalea sp.]
LAERDVGRKQSLPEFFEQYLASGCPAARLPCQKPPTVGATSSASSALAGYEGDFLVCQHPTLKSRISSFFQRLTEGLAAVSVAAASVIAVIYGRGIFLSTAENDKSDILAECCGKQ